MRYGREGEGTTPFGGTLVRLKTHFKKFDPCQPYDKDKDDSKVGTGFLLQVNEKEKRIVTSFHVVDHAVKILARVPEHDEGESTPLELLEYNACLDVAFLRCPPEMETLTAFRPGRSSSLQMGSDERLNVLGYGMGTLWLHKTNGIVSGRRGSPYNRFQTNAVVHPGNSGGPVLLEGSKDVVGIVTSGFDGVQATNFFAGMDEALVSWRRAVACSGVDAGYHLNAVVKPVGRAACGGHAGGALVAGAMPGVPLGKGDVVRAIREPGGEWCALNSAMEIASSRICPFQEVDFRTVLDFMQEDKVHLKVRRATHSNGEEEDVTFRVTANRFMSRERHPQVDTYPYISLGGLILCPLSPPCFDEDSCHFRNPYVLMHSRACVVHVVAGSAFEPSYRVDLMGATVTAIHSPEEVELKCFRDACSHLSSCLDAGSKDIILDLDTGDRIGASVQSILDFHNASPPHLSPGLHNAGRSGRR